MTQIHQIWKNTHDVKPQEGRDLLIVRKRGRTYYQFGLYNSDNDRVMITSPTGFPWQSFEEFDIWAYLDDLLSISEEPTNERNLANSAKSCKDLQEPVKHKSDPLFDECVANVPDWVMKETSDKIDAMIASEDLEKYRTEYVDNEIKRIYPDLSPHLPRKSKVRLNVFNGEDLEEAIDNAVRWQKKQMMKDAVDGPFIRRNRYTKKNVLNNFDLTHDALQGFKDGQRLKVIFLPSDNK